LLAQCGTSNCEQVKLPSYQSQKQIKTSKNCWRITRLTRPISPAEKINGLLFNIIIN
jgi:hypothetical protein